MVFLARLILKGPSQAALVAATLAILGILLIPFIWLSGAAVGLVALVKDNRQTSLVIGMTAAGTTVFASLIFAAPSMVLYFLLAAWLPVWLAAYMLRTSTLAASLQLISGISLLAIAGLYAFFPNMGEYWREPMDLMAQQLYEQSQGQWSLEVLQDVKDLAIKMIPGLLVCSVLFGTMISLFLARWWQAVIFNPGGFGKEFKALNLGKTTAIFAMLIVVIVALAGSELWYAMLLVVLALYTTQSVSILHAVFDGKRLNKVWLYLIYLVMFFSPEVAALMILLGISDAWIDFRRRLITQ
ncbi:MAG: YybS family protein [Gammaproteobacteria bacterium]|nr:YybS family protein [Gammaproteobacteria bacterium]